MSAPGFSDVFAAAVRASLGDSGTDYPLKARVEDLSRSGEVERLFPGRSKLWLQKELSKWRSKLSEGRFSGTLQALELYCTLTGLQPNDVLLPPGRYRGPAMVEFLSLATILDLAETMQREGIVPRLGCALPVLYAPVEMTAVFLFLYPQRQAGRDSVLLRFGISEPDGYAEWDGTDIVGGISTAADSSAYIADLSRSEGITRLREAYRKIRSEFDAICAAADTPLNDAIQAFYDMAAPWEPENRDDLLFAWYPPRKKAPAQPRPGRLSDLLSHLEDGGER